MNRGNLGGKSGAQAKEKFRSNGFVLVEMNESLEEIDVDDFYQDEFADIIQQELEDIETTKREGR